MLLESDWLKRYQNRDGDQTGLIINATEEQRKENPIGAAIRDFSHAGLTLMGLNAIDNFIANRFNPENNTVIQIAKEAVVLGIATTRGEGGVMPEKAGPIEGPQVALLTAEGNGAGGAGDVFIVTPQGVILPKGAVIPEHFTENPHRPGNYGTGTGKNYVEKVRIDPATPPNKKGPNKSHFHLDRGEEHIMDPNRWPWWSNAGKK